MSIPMPTRQFRTQLAAATCLGLLTMGLIGGATAQVTPTSRFYPTVGNTPLPAADPRAVYRYGHSPLSLLGPSRLTASQMATAVSSSHVPRVTVSIDELAQIFVEEGAAFGVRADLAWAQSIVETGWFTFPDRGLVHPQDNNFAGIGACDSCSGGNHYEDARTGVRSQMQLLRGYADPHRLSNPISKPPTSYLGIAPTWFDMGDGHWATSTRYAESVISVYTNLLDLNGLTLEYDPAQQRDPEPVMPLRLGDGLFLAGIDGQVYDVGDARFWGSASGRDLHSPVVAVVPTPTASGYWVIMAGGAIFGFGDAPEYERPKPRGRTVVTAAAASPRGIGFWTVTRSGEVRAFGDAEIADPTVEMNSPGALTVAIAATPSGLGYWLVNSDGVVTSFGDAVDFGSVAKARLRDPIVGIAATPDGTGYWLVSSHGRIFDFGSARTYGGLFPELDAQLEIDNFESFEDLTAEARSQVSDHPVVAIATTQTGLGYWIITTDGLVIGRGDAADFGDATPAGEAIVGATSRRT